MRLRNGRRHVVAVRDGTLRRHSGRTRFRDGGAGAFGFRVDARPLRDLSAEDLRIRFVAYLPRRGSGDGADRRAHTDHGDFPDSLTYSHLRLLKSK